MASTKSANAHAQKGKTSANNVAVTVGRYLFGLVCLAKAVTEFSREPIYPIFGGVAYLWLAAVTVPLTDKVFADLPTDVRRWIRAAVGVTPVAVFAALLAFTYLERPDQPQLASTATKSAPKSAALKTPSPELQKLLDEDAKLTDEDRFIRRIDTELLPAVAAVDASAPTSIQEVWKRSGDLNFLRLQVSEGSALKFSAAQKAKFDKFKAALSAKQVVLLPRMRTAYREGMKSALWEHDIDVKGSGRQIEFVGGFYAARANIKAAEEGLEPDLKRLRFKYADYRWLTGADGTRYTLSTPTDSDLARD